MTGNEEWKRFIRSGKVEDYIHYKKQQKEPPRPENAVNLRAENKIQKKTGLG